MFCILCQCQWKAIKVSTRAMLMAKDAKKKLRKSPSGVPTPKKKPTKLITASHAVLCELRSVAAFYSQVYIFTKVEKSKVDLCIALIEEHFYGHPQKHIKGACKIMIAGEGPLRVLYNIIEGKTKTELVLKVSCCGRDTVSSYVAGVHFTVQDLITFGVNKKLKGRQLWAMGLIFMHSIKKALSVVTNFAPLFCIINKIVL